MQHGAIIHCLMSGPLDIVVPNTLNIQPSAMELSWSCAVGHVWLHNNNHKNSMTECEQYKHFVVLDSKENRLPITDESQYRTGKLVLVYTYNSQDQPITQKQHLKYLELNITNTRGLLFWKACEEIGESSLHE